jgi:hypothetical protein
MAATVWSWCASGMEVEHERSTTWRPVLDGFRATANSNNRRLKDIFMQNNGRIIAKGSFRQLGHRKLCPGVYEIFLKQDTHGECVYCGRCESRAVIEKATGATP